MSSRTPIWRYAILFLAFLSLSLAASPTSFCKCTCFTNSTIIPLNAKPSSLKSNSFFTSSDDTTPDDDSGTSGSSPTPPRTCADCNKQFCLSYNLPICQEAEDADVFTTCFQRDSTKDQIVIYLFIGATVGLLGWAGVKPWWEKWSEMRGRSLYEPVGGQ